MIRVRVGFTVEIDDDGAEDFALGVQRQVEALRGVKSFSSASFGFAFNAKPVTRCEVCREPMKGKGLPFGPQGGVVHRGCRPVPAGEPAPAPGEGGAK